MAQDPAPTPTARKRAAQLRAMIILKLSAYMNPKAPVVQSSEDSKAYHIGVVGKDLLGQAILDKLPGKKVKKRVVRVSQIEPAAAAKLTARKYDLLFVASTVDAATLAKIVAAHRRIATPVVCERPGFVKQGGGLQLFVRNNKVRFELNHDALKKQGIKVSPQLLKLSTKGPVK